MSTESSVLPKRNIPKSISKEELEVVIIESRTYKEILSKLGRLDTAAENRNLKNYMREYDIALPLRKTVSMSPTNLPKEKMIELIENSSSIKEIIEKLEVKVDTSSYRQLRFLAKKYDLILPKYVLTDEMKAKRINLKISLVPDEEFFTNGVHRSQSSLKIRLLKTGVDYLCSGISCPSPNPEWAGKPLTLQLDHINGDPFDNRIENLRFLCPNCHTQTETYGSKNSTRLTKLTKSRPKISIPRKSKIEWPSVKEVIEKVKEKGYLEYGKELGVSDNAIRKYLDRNEVSPLPKFR